MLIITVLSQPSHPISLSALFSASYQAPHARIRAMMGALSTAQFSLSCENNLFYFSNRAGVRVFAASRADSQNRVQNGTYSAQSIDQL